MTSRIPATIFAAIVLFAIGLAAAGFDPREFSRAHGGTMRVSIATGITGGVYYPYGGGLARVISQSIPHVDATAEVTAASVDNLKLIQLGKTDCCSTRAGVGRCGARAVRDCNRAAPGAHETARRNRLTTI